MSGSVPEGDRAARISRGFAQFADEYSTLPLYSRLTRGAASDAQVAALLLSARPGQARPVLWLAALHDLVLRRPDLPLAQWYGSVVGADRIRTDDPWPEARATVLAHEDELRTTIATRSTQTNEVNRSVYVAAGLSAAAADLPADTPTALVELGSSAGLLLAVDRYAITLTHGGQSRTVGDPGSPVRCIGEDRSDTTRRSAGPAETADAPTSVVLPPVVARVGIDREPVDLRDAEATRWLLACLWPDVPERVERFVAARDLLQDAPPPVRTGDLVDGLPGALAEMRAAVAATDPGDTPGHVVCFSSWALTYVERARRDGIVQHLAALSQEGVAVSWFTAEPPGTAPGIDVGDTEIPGGTVLGLRRWRDGAEATPQVLGSCHPHGSWIALTSS